MPAQHTTVMYIINLLFSVLSGVYIHSTVWFFRLNYEPTSCIAIFCYSFSVKIWICINNRTVNLHNIKHIINFFYSSMKYKCKLCTFYLLVPIWNTILYMYVKINRSAVLAVRHNDHINETHLKTTLLWKLYYLLALRAVTAY